MNILFIGDIVGSVGREMVRCHLPLLKSRYDIDLVVGNGENAAHGKGITRRIYHQLISYGIDVMTMTGFLDGINDSLVKANPIEEMEEDTAVNLGFDKELLYKNMVAAEADWLYNLEEWNSIFDEEKRKELYKEQKRSGTIVKEAKVYPNDPCPCGSGKKYKKCCGKNR